MTWIVRYITHYDLDLYQRLGWRVTGYEGRGDDLGCFIASFCCCRN